MTNLLPQISLNQASKSFFEHAALLTPNKQPPPPPNSEGAVWLCRTDRFLEFVDAGESNRNRSC